MQDNFQTQLPDDVLDFLSNFDAVEFAQGLVKKYNLKDADVIRIMNLAEDVTRSEVKLDQLPTKLSEQFGLDQMKAKQVAIEIAEERLLPVQQVVGNVREQIKAWGGDLSNLPEIKDLSVSPESFIHTFVFALPGEMPTHLENRLEHFLLSYYSGSPRKEIVEDMMRSEKVGGLAFKETDAGNLLDYFDEKKTGVLFKKEIGGVPVYVGDGRDRPAQPSPIAIPIEIAEPIVVPKIVVTEPVADVVKKEIVVDDILPKEPVHKDIPSKLDDDLEQDEKDIEKIKIDKQAALENQIDAPMTVEDLVSSVCSLESMRFENEHLGDRCRQIVESRLREVRTATDTKNLIERSVEAGGLGVTGRKLADMTQAIENSFDSFQNLFAKKVEDERKGHADSRAERVLEKQTLVEKEEKAMTKRYIEMTGKVPDHHESSVNPSGTRVSASSTAEDALQIREKKIDTAKVRSAIEAAKPSSPAVAGRDLSSRAIVKPTTQDIQFTKRLSGPIDELHAMTLTDFRRISKDPTASAEKIKDQVDLVEDQGYEKKVEAIHAWQSSPLYLMYLQIARTSMQEGRPLEDVRQEKEKDGSVSLTKEELSAILTLNRKLRF